MHNRTRYITLYLSVTILIFITGSCNGKAALNAADSAVVKKELVVKEQQPAGKAAKNDEQQFRVFLKEFKAAVQQKNKKQLALMINFPLQTLPQWTSEDLKSTTVKPEEGLVTESEYPQYADALFTKDVMRLIPKSKEADLSEIDTANPEDYYKTVGKVTDKGSTLYELQQQYEQDNGKETSYGFVFGKVKGKYKIISYFCPWPVKG